MRDYKSLSHTSWDCKYHIVFIPKRRQKLIFGGLRKHHDEEMVREYIRNQEKQDEHREQLKFGM
mgnify:CR=1